MHIQVVNETSEELHTDDNQRIRALEQHVLQIVREINDERRSSENRIELIIWRHAPLRSIRAYPTLVVPEARGARHGRSFSLQEESDGERFFSATSSASGADDVEENAEAEVGAGAPEAQEEVEAEGSVAAKENGKE